VKKPPHRREARSEGGMNVYVHSAVQKR